MNEEKIIFNKKNFFHFSNNQSFNINFINNKIILTKFCTIIILFIFIFKYFTNNNFLTNKIDFEFKNHLKNIIKNDDDIIENELLSKHTTFRLGGPAKFFIRPKTNNQIIKIIELCNKYKIHYFILGNGSNLLVSDIGYNGVIIQIYEKYFSNLEIRKDDENNYNLIVGGGMPMRTLSIEACLLSLTGLEDIIDIPGTVGGGIIMNASYKRTALTNSLIKVKAITPDGKEIELTKEECGLTKRGSILKNNKYIVIEARFKLQKDDPIIIQKTMTNNTMSRYEKQPMYFGSAGCFFVWDHAKYGGMYEKYKKSNLVSYRVGNAMIYTYNIAFIVNLGNATANQVMEIVKYIENIMRKQYKIKIKREVIVIGSYLLFISI